MSQPDHIVVVSLPRPEDLEDDIQAYFTTCAEKLGFVPNVVRAFTVNPDKVRNFDAYFGKPMLDKENCGLSKLEREMIAVVVSSANR